MMSQHRADGLALYYTISENISYCRPIYTSTPTGILYHLVAGIDYLYIEIFLINLCM